MTDTEAGLLRAVLERPDDDLPRLVLADYWDEHGQPERGEFVRVQVELARLERRAAELSLYRPEEMLTDDEVAAISRLRRRERELLEWFCAEDLAVELGLPPHESLFITGSGWVCPRLGVELVTRRGFVEYVTAPLAVLFGGECGRCDDSNEAWQRRRAAEFQRENCPDCHGTGRTPGVAPRLFACQPVLRVTLTGTTPLNFAHEHWHWMRGGSHRFSLPEELYDLLPSRSECGKGCEETQADALDALLQASVALGRSVAAGHTHTVRCESCSGEGCDFKGHGDPKLFCDGSGEVRRRGLPPLRGGVTAAAGGAGHP